ncbi:MAG TPA: DUF2500 domain-containing protein [Candidatus Faecivivens stercoripullorum]|uniref:DUF2500 domain-containing protein n=1 Tax=Candidatus Faecivivens stercoripullorum TaxID=2840805 RepID=A0A9D1KSL1_9FIRM|nr:DUF2500 domain-containing protein [Candidatus Faecivivens stercoripullorum]
MMMGWGFDLISALFPILFLLIFVIVIGTFIVATVRGISRWNKNNHSPVLDVEALVVSRRADVTSHMNHHDHMSTRHMSTRYYVTFEVASGDRMELSVSGEEYGLIAEGDRGTLRFQGTRFLSFQRKW